MFQDRPVVYRSSWLIRALAAAQAAGKEFIVLTPSDAALALPLSELLSRPGGQWLATTADGEPWDIAAVTSYCYDVAPTPAALVVVGHPRPGTDAPTIATLTVERASTGVHESLELLAKAPAPLSEAELESFSAAMHRARVRTALLGHARGYSKLARPARFTGMSVPGCAVFGPEAIKGSGADRALALAGPCARLNGVPPLQSLAVTYAQEPVPGQLHPLEEHIQLVARLECAKL